MIPFDCSYICLSGIAAPNISSCMRIYQTPYLTYMHTVTHPTSWHMFAILNTFHHFLMYAYFGGITTFSDILPWTGYAQLLVGIAVEGWVGLGGCDGGGDWGGGWWNAVVLGLLGVYAVLFWGDLRGRGKKGL